MRTAAQGVGRSPKRIRVLVIMPDLADGGAERFFVTLAAQLFDSDVEMHLLTVQQSSERYLAEAGRLFHSYRNLNEHRRWRSALPSILKAFARSFRDIRPDIVIAMLNEWNAFIPIARAASRHRFRFVTSIHISLEETWGRFAEPAQRVMRLLYRHAHRKSDLVLTVSTEQAEVLRSWFPGVTPVRALPVPVDLEDIYVQADTEETHPWFSESTPVLVAAGRLIEQKGFDVLLHALTQVRSPARLLLLGAGPLDGYLKDIIGRLGLGDRVKMIGFRSNPFPLIAKADAFVFPSRWEALGYVIVEALALSTPVIATSCNFGPREVIEDGETGLIVPVDDPRALAFAIDKLLQDEDLAAGFRERGPCVAERFRADVVAKEYLDCLLELS